MLQDENPEFGEMHSPLPFSAPEDIKSPEQAKDMLYSLPVKKDLLRILALAEVIHNHENQDSPDIWVLDVGAGSGFIDKLLVDVAREKGINLHAVVLDPNEEMMNTARAYYGEQGERNLHFIVSKSEEAKSLFNRQFDLVLNSWMGLHQDLGQDIRQINAGARVYIMEHSGATGTEEAYEPGEDWFSYGSWFSLAGNDLMMAKRRGDDFRINWPPSCLDIIQLPQRIKDSETEKNLDEKLKLIDAMDIPEGKLYSWEKNIQFRREGKEVTFEKNES